jgi:hypothetical protein
VTDHHRKTREKQALRNGDAVHGISGFDPSESRFHTSFQGDHTSSRPSGDYDPMQVNQFLTYHSNSADTRLINGRSSTASSGKGSVASSDGGQNSQQGFQQQSLTGSFADAPPSAKVEAFIEEQLEPEDSAKPRNLLPPVAEGEVESALFNIGSKGLEKAGADQTSSTEIDIESGESADSPASERNKTRDEPPGKKNPQEDGHWYCRD